MALTDETSNGMVLPVTPLGNGSGYGSGDCFGGTGFWILLLFLLIGNNGWGGFGGYGGGNELYPWMNQNNQINDGFRDQMINGNITEIRNGVTGLATQMCNGFAGVEQGANARQIANMQQNFASQTAVTGAINDLASQQASCCCENRLASANLVNTIQSENCADRQTLNEGVRDIIANQTAGIQTILDKLCQQEIDAKNNEIANLRTQLNMQNLAASQSAQTAQLIADNNGQTKDLINRIAPYPVPSYVVPNPYSYGGNCGCGCGA